MVYISWVIYIVLAGANILWSRKPRTARNILEIVTLYLLAINVGIGGLFAFYGHIFMPDMVARSIGWATGSGFQAEIGFANLAFGIVGILCIWLRGNFWLAAAINSLVFNLGAGFVHIRDIMANQNLAVNNAGPVLWVADIFSPLLLITMVLIFRKLDKTSSL